MKFTFYVDGKRQEVPNLHWAIILLRAAIEDGKAYGCLEFMRRAGE